MLRVLFYSALLATVAARRMRKQRAVAQPAHGGGHGLCVCTANDETNAADGGLLQMVRDAEPACKAVAFALQDYRGSDMKDLTVVASLSAPDNAQLDLKGKGPKAFSGMSEAKDCSGGSGKTCGIPAIAVSEAPCFAGPEQVIDMFSDFTASTVKGTVGVKFGDLLVVSSHGTEGIRCKKAEDAGSCAAYAEGGAKCLDAKSSQQTFDEATGVFTKKFEGIDAEAQRLKHFRKATAAVQKAGESGGKTIWGMDMNVRRQYGTDAPNKFGCPNFEAEGEAGTAYDAEWAKMDFLGWEDDKATLVTAAEALAGFTYHPTKTATYQKNGVDSYDSAKKPVTFCDRIYTGPRVADRVTVFKVPRESDHDIVCAKVSGGGSSSSKGLEKLQPIEPAPMEQPVAPAPVDQPVEQAPEQPVE